MEFSLNGKIKKSKMVKNYKRQCLIAVRLIVY